MPKKGYYFIATIRKGKKEWKEKFGGSGLFKGKSEQWIRREIKDWVKRVGKAGTKRYKGAKVVSLKKVTVKPKRKRRRTYW